MWGILTTDVNISWFILGYATSAVVISKIFRKKSIVIAGGWDVVNMPEIGYGAMQSSKRIRYTKYALKYADRVLSVSKSTDKEVKQWISFSKSEILYHGFDSELFKSGGKKENLVITVGGVNKQTLIKKGLKTFVETAQYLQNLKFILIGKHQDESIDYLKSIASKNVEFTGYISFDELLQYYKKAKVYVQVSGHESFGCSLAEAMLCECIPVVTNRTAIPEVVGNTGYYVEFNNPKDTAEKIKEALVSNKGRVARERIEKCYSIEKRKRELINSIHRVFYNNNANYES